MIMINRYLFLRYPGGLHKLFHTVAESLYVYGMVTHSALHFVMHFDRLQPLSLLSILTDSASGITV